jgi:hypothetical protein
MFSDLLTSEAKPAKPCYLCQGIQAQLVNALAPYCVAHTLWQALLATEETFNRPQPQTQHPTRNNQTQHPSSGCHVLRQVWEANSTAQVPNAIHAIPRRHMHDRHGLLPSPLFATSGCNPHANTPAAACAAARVP